MATVSAPAFFRVVMAGSFASLLAACGGGSDDAAAPEPPPRTATAAAVGDTWQTVALEGRSFTLATATVVRYGAGTRWVQRTLSGTVSCTNATFGSDPAFGVQKSCQVQTGSGEPPPASISPTGLPATPTRSARPVAMRPSTRISPSRSALTSPHRASRSSGGSASSGGLPCAAAWAARSCSPAASPFA